MPELPEVEHARAQLTAWLPGRRVVAARAEDTRLLRGSDPAAFRVALEGRMVEAVRRRGKWLRIDAAGGTGLLAHLGMSGRFAAADAAAPAPPHARARLDLEDGRRVHYVSVRLLGRLVPGTSAELDAVPAWRAQGPDPLADPFDAEVLARALAGARGPIKAALMDQRRIAGLGNIQAGESLFLAGLHPLTPTPALDRAALERLHAAIARTLEDTLARLRDDARYLSEGGPNPFHVYGRAGEPCPACGRPLQRLVHGGRSAFFCPRCQPAP